MLIFLYGTKGKRLIHHYTKFYTDWSTNNGPRPTLPVGLLFTTFGVDILLPNNLLANLPDHALEKFQSLTSIDLSNNPLAELGYRSLSLLEKGLCSLRSSWKPAYNSCVNKYFDCLALYIGTTSTIGRSDTTYA